MKQLLTLFAFFTWCCPLNAQLYIPRNVQKAINTGTRSVSGAPGPHYWQNKGVYDIRVRLDPADASVTGEETINYSNNSPDTLAFLAIRFVNNFRKGSGNEGLEITHLNINGEDYGFNNDVMGTVAAIRLENPISPHSNNTIKINWNYTLSYPSGREGVIDSTTFFAAYSYPRISVYDDYNGWDLVPHTGRQEFYNDFNDYSLEVNVPKNYVVWATGDLQNPREVLQKEVAARLERSYTSDEIFKIADVEETAQGNVTVQNERNTWVFTANHITDVCWAASKNYVWDAGSVIVDSATGRRASVQAAYNNTALDFHNYVEWAKNSLRYFSTSLPGVSYPYSKMTSFQGYADMEYPMMVNDASVSNMRDAQFVQDHEIAHTYFPFYMGINETRYAFMDEGWATFFEYFIGIQEFGKAYADSVFKSFRVQRYISDPSTEEDQPIISLSTQVSGMGYGSNAYGKPALSYIALRELLGEALFKKTLHYYMDLWHGKHPIPWDFFNSFNAGSGQNLNWFFKNWYFSNNYIDLSIDSVLPRSIVIANKGGFAIPFDVNILYADGIRERLHYSPVVWKKNEKQARIELKSKKEIRQVHVDGGIFMDYTPEDNVFVRKKMSF